MIIMARASAESGAAGPAGPKGRRGLFRARTPATIIITYITIVTITMIIIIISSIIVIIIIIITIARSLPAQGGSDEAGSVERGGGACTAPDFTESPETRGFDPSRLRFVRAETPVYKGKFPHLLTPDPY